VKALLINGSPHRAAAASRVILDTLKAKLGPRHEYRMIEVVTQREALPEDLEADLLVLAFPLYVDSLPSPVLDWLISCERLRSETSRSGGALKPQAMIAVVNCGFYEGVQNESALAIVANFCARAGIQWRGGLGIGSGGMMKGVESAPENMFIKRPVSRAITELAELALDPSRGPRVIYASHAFPRRLYIAAAHSGWRHDARANGLKVRDLGAMPYLPAQLPH
jgi:hypothetical protein